MPTVEASGRRAHGCCALAAPSVDGGGGGRRQDGPAADWLRQSQARATGCLFLCPTPALLIRIHFHSPPFMLIDGGYHLSMLPHCCMACCFEVPEAGKELCQLHLKRGGLHLQVQKLGGCQRVAAGSENLCRVQESQVLLAGLPEGSMEGAQGSVQRRGCPSGCGRLGGRMGFIGERSGVRLTARTA